MTVTIITVHPAVTIVRAEEQQFELPTNLFPAAPRAGQVWTIALTHQPSSAEQLEELNDYLNPA